MAIKEIIRKAAAPEETVASDDRDIFAVANLYPETTGLPMTVWISPRGTARYDVRIKVKMTHGNRMNIANTAVVGVRPRTRVITGRLSPADTQAVFEWVTLNTDALLAYWDGRIDTARIIQALKSLSAIGQPGAAPEP